MLLVLTVLICLSFSATAQSPNNVTVGASLMADDENLSWVSPSEDFAFGFQRIGPDGGFLLAIWFNKIPEKTIVWSANRDSPAEEGSKIQLVRNGMSATDPRGREIWQTGLLMISGEVAYGAMLDSGNFMLGSNTSAVMWQSFDNATDTLLPTQVLNQGRGLMSSFSETNYSTGRFSLTLLFTGKIVFQTGNILMNSVMTTYSTREAIGFQLIFNQSGYIFLASSNRTAVDFLSFNGASTSQFYQRAVLEYDGVFRHYVYPKSANVTAGREMKWSVLANFPINLCSLTFGGMSYGSCGPNSYCSMQNGRPVCRCPPGYSPMNSDIRNYGCKPDFIQHNCDQESQEADDFILIDVPQIDFDLGDYFGYRSMNEDQCRQVCLSDCFCAAVVYERRNCWKKRYPLPNALAHTNRNLRTLIKIRKNDSTVHRPSNNPLPNERNRSSFALIIILSVLLGSSVFFILLLTSILMRCLSSKKKESTAHQNNPGWGVRIFSFEDLLEATEGFKEVLGKGAHSTVYRGAQKDQLGKLVAVKKLINIAPEAESEFEAEVSAISKTNHKNLVHLVGYCNAAQNRLLVYEFMSGGSLANFLFQDSKPSWYRRVQIALGIAKGLCYLHEECRVQIIHCDIKPQNILLDESLTARISDFGLAKILSPDESKTITAMRGTRGYAAPEWFRNIPITYKVDVYSFGILLLELVCCRRNVELDADNEIKVILADWAYDCCEEGTLNLLVPDGDEAIEDMKRFTKFVMIGIWCIQEDPASRPNMKRVVHMLEGAVEVPKPPHPESFIS